MTMRSYTFRTVPETGVNSRWVFGHANAGMVVIDADGAFVDANPAFCRLVGRDYADLLGARSLDLLEKADGPTTLPDDGIHAFQGEYAVRNPRTGDLVRLLA